MQLKEQSISAYGESLPLKPAMTLEADVVQGKLDKNIDQKILMRMKVTH